MIEAKPEILFALFHNWACDDQDSKEYSFQYFITFFSSHFKVTR